MISMLKYNASSEDINNYLQNTHFIRIILLLPVKTKRVSQRYQEILSGISLCVPVCREG